MQQEYFQSPILPSPHFWWVVNQSDLILWLIPRVCLCLQSKHPDMPKKPLTPYFRYFMEKRAKYSQQHPDLSMTEISMVLAQRYRALQDKKKVRTKTHRPDWQLLQQERVVDLTLLLLLKNWKNVASYSRFIGEDCSALS